MLLNEDENHRLVSREGEMNMKHYIKIDNTRLTPEETAAMICKAFQL